MKEKLVLELIQAGRLSVEDGAKLLGINIPEQAKAPKPQTLKTTKITRQKQKQTIYSLDDHKTIVETVKACNNNIRRAAKSLGISDATVRNHAAYAGLYPCYTGYRVNSVNRWRRNNKMYLHLAPAKITIRPSLMANSQQQATEENSAKTLWGA